MRKILLATVAVAGLFASPGAQAQSPGDGARDRLAPLANDATDANGLRGGIQPEDDPSDAGRRSASRDAETEIEKAREAALLRDGSLLPRPDDDLLRPGPAAIADRGLGIDEELPREPVEEDPYAPLGVRFGSFLLFPELLAESAYQDNIFLSGTNPEGDWSLVFTPRLTARSDWNRHTLEATVAGVRSFHDRFPSEDDKTFTAETTGQVDIRRDTNIVASAAYAEFFEDRGSSDFPSNAATRAKTRSKDASLEGNHTFNRVTVTLRGEIAQQDYDDSFATDGSLINNDDRDYTEPKLVGRVAYALQPGISAFVEASGNERDFTQPVDDNGTISNSSGHDVQAGLSFKLSGKLTGEASAGYALQNPDDPNLRDVNGLIFNAGLEWKASALTTVRFDADSEVAQSVEAGNAGSIIRNVELSVEHRPRQHIRLGAAVGYQQETFTGVDQKDEEWSVGLSGEYIFTPSVALTVDYEHLESMGNVPGDDYTTNQVRMGLRVRR